MHSKKDLSSLKSTLNLEITWLDIKWLLLTYTWLHLYYHHSNCYLTKKCGTKHYQTSQDLWFLISRASTLLKLSVEFNSALKVWHQTLISKLKRNNLIQRKTIRKKIQAIKRKEMTRRREEIRRVQIKRELIKRQKKMVERKSKRQYQKFQKVILQKIGKHLFRH